MFVCHMGLVICVNIFILKLRFEVIGFQYDNNYK